MRFVCGLCHRPFHDLERHRRAEPERIGPAAEAAASDERSSQGLIVPCSGRSRSSMRIGTRPRTPPRSASHGVAPRPVAA